mgnify:CR=1 FL=1|jgi:hypothetical protein
MIGVSKSPWRAGEVEWHDLSVPDGFVPKLGRAKRHRVREAFKHEAHHFTPWLAENLDLLGDEIGIPLTLVGTEVAIGSFSLDIQACDPDGRTVAIENQFERSDHDHLGKSLVYAAGLEASVVVWVAEEFREEHRQVFDWLNSNSDEGVSFYAVSVSTLTIDGSAPAPVFRVASRPNHFQKGVKTETHRWDRVSFLEAIAKTNSSYSPIAEKVFAFADEQNWHCWHGTGRIYGSAFFYCADNQHPMLLAMYTSGDFRGGWSNHESHRGDQRWMPVISFFQGLDPTKRQNLDEYSHLSFDLLADDSVLEQLLQTASATESAFHPE